MSAGDLLLVVVTTVVCTSVVAVLAWAALHAKRDDPARDVVLLEGETCGFGGSGRNGGFCVASLTHGLHNGAARFADELATLERLGLLHHAAV